MKKQISILFLFIACIIMQAHAVVPHHHHDSGQELQAHHSSHDHDNDHDSHDEGKEGGFEGLIHLFSHFTHSADGFSYVHSDNTENTISKQTVFIVVRLFDNFNIDRFTIPPLLILPASKRIISPHSISSGLRAPPVFLA